MRANREFLPPLLRGMGTLLICIVSVPVVLVERHEQRARVERAELLHSRLAVEVAAPVPRGGEGRLADEVRRLRLQLQQQDLADEVLQNVWFQLAGLLGTSLIAGSFLLEAWQKRRPPHPEHDSPDGPG